MESLWLSHVPSPLCSAYYSEDQFCDDDCNKKRFRRMVALEFVTLMLGWFLQTATYDITTQYHAGRIQQT